MNLLERFEHPQDFDGQMPPDQQQAAGPQYFSRSQDPQLQQSPRSFRRNIPDPQVLGQMHDYARHTDPSKPQRVMDHPVLDAALVGVGIHEFRQHEEAR